MRESVIIVAGGKGERMQNDTPKQFLPLGGLPVLMHTIKRFYDYSNNIEIIVVLPEQHINFWRNLCLKYNFNIAHSIVSGGKNRQESVKNGLEIINNKSITAIHDGVRPLLPKEFIERMFKRAKKDGNAVPAIKLSDSIRRISDDNSFCVNRNDYLLIQTPQIFNSDILKQAYNVNDLDTFTDDASIVENYGIKINIEEGEYCNIKITNPVDFIVAETLLKNI